MYVKTNYPSLFNTRATLTAILIYLVSLLLPAGFSPRAYSADKDNDKIIRIGVRANRGADKALKRWQPTADYLSEKIPGYRFTLAPYEINSTLNQAASRNEFEFILTNPAAYVELRHRYGVEKLVTLANKRNGTGYTKFGSVIFTHKDNADINDFQDLKGVEFLAADELGFGGWRMAWRELLAHKINPYHDFKTLRFAGGIQQRVVHAVLNKTVDAGSVRTDMLERMAQDGKITLSDVKVIGQKQAEDFPFLLSTALYPEWPFAKLKHTDDMLAKRVTASLLLINKNHPAAVSGKYTGWHTGLQYDEVENMLKELHIGPFAIHKQSLIMEVIKLYWHWFFIFAIILFLLITLYIKMALINTRLRVTENQLLESNSKVRDLALIDGLTALGNRRSLNEHLDKVWGQMCRDNIPVCILLMDVDYFKDFNDLYGHVAGDDCLRKIANTIQEFFRRSGEIAIRYGGEEFLIFKTHCDLSKIQQHAEDFRLLIRNLNILHAKSTIDSVVTVSIGIAVMTPDKDSDPRALIKQADHALYQAKNSGRNCVVIYGEKQQEDVLNV